MGAVVAAIAAGVFGIAGALTSILVGRRQTTDQAAVEYGQRLRGQRQEAFANYFKAWDKTHQQFEDIAENIDEHTSRENFDSDRYEQEVAENPRRERAGRGGA
ncbi:hypothetical protein [Streptomyces sp. 1-11]|uniref:hypothetical protein n=1 Tax=Streptomyces sp. 1-11 TaxID=2590549 RepID=UPI001170BE91|nr:hypothetical protein [Streptomyces sp. 1-11]GEK04453.1 hypothetical protein TNCT1_67290 [Streptomyces sp. 1-11]